MVISNLLKLFILAKKQKEQKEQSSQRGGGWLSGWWWGGSQSNVRVCFSFNLIGFVSSLLFII